MREGLMKMDKPNCKFIPLVFGTMGLILVVLALSIPTATPERIMVAVFGSVGIFIAIVQIAIQKRNATGKPNPVSVDIETDDTPH